MPVVISESVQCAARSKFLKRIELFFKGSIVNEFGASEVAPVDDGRDTILFLKFSFEVISISLALASRVVPVTDEVVSGTRNSSSSILRWEETVRVIRPIAFSSQTSRAATLAASDEIALSAPCRAFQTLEKRAAALISRAHS